MTGAAGRFVTEEVLKLKEEQRKRDWDAAYERIGQKPPKMEEVAYDGRTLFEKLQENKIKEEEEFEKMFKLSAQYRGIDEEESAFLNGMRERAAEAERKRVAEAEEEVLKYREMLASRQEAPPAIASPIASTSAAKPAARPAAKPPAPVKSKPTQRSLLAGAIKKKPSADAAKRRTSEATLDAAKQQKP